MTPNRLGRPPATDSAATRAKIIDCARRRFATKGYDATQIRVIAEDADLTTAALYHYFANKLDLFGAVYGETQQVIYDRIEAAIAADPSFIGRLRALLDTLDDLNLVDPTYSRLLTTARIDGGRDPELAAALRTGGQTHRWRRMIGDIVEAGITAGRVPPDKAAELSILLHTFAVGTINAAAHDPVAFRQAVDAFLELVDGTLLHPAPDD